MSSRLRPLLTLTLVAAVLWHAMAVSTVVGGKGPAGRELATWHYAARVALADGDPYDRIALVKVAQADGTRSSVVPPRATPPSIALGLPTVGMPLTAAWQVHVGLGELAFVLALAALARWWRPLGEPAVVGAVAVAAVAASVPIAVDAAGPTPLVLLLAIVAGWQDGRRPALAGALVGLAACLQPLVGLLAVPWLAGRRLVPVGAALGVAVLAHLAVLPLVGVDTVLAYYTGVVPGLLGGDWTGTGMPIGAVTNHALIGAVAPKAQTLSAGLAAAQLVVGAGIVVALGWAFRRPAAATEAAAASEAVDRTLVVAARTAAFLVAGLLVASYTTEPDLTLALPAAWVAIAAVMHGRLGAAWAVPVGLAVGLLVYPTAPLEDFVQLVLAQGLPAAAPIVAEAETVALVALLVATARLRR